MGTSQPGAAVGMAKIEAWQISIALHTKISVVSETISIRQKADLLAPTPG
jgi:hypothetical protein